ncbi:MAG: hypothetical protein JXA37_03525 [Chloroflexia bacterium]|nr:hypothetical protein [Chloroflexia bacterium]
MTDGGSLQLETSQETIEAQMPYQGKVQPPASGLTHWAYSLVIEGMDPSVPYKVVLSDASSGEEVASAETTDGIVSIEGELAEVVHELHIESAKPNSFRAICTQTYGYRQ